MYDFFLNEDQEIEKLLYGKAVRRAVALGRGRAWLGRGMRELCRVMEMFSIWIGLGFTWVYTLIKTH